MKQLLVRGRRIFAEAERLAKKNGQALLELALFGAFLIMLLGVLVNYGLNYYFQMKVKADAFRNSMAQAANSSQNNSSSSVSTIYISDKYIPDPSHPFGIGYTVPISSSAPGITRNPDLRIGPDNVNELPKTQIFIGGDQPMNFTSGKFVNVTYITELQFHKYQEIYGDTLGCGKWTSGQCTSWLPMYNSKGKINPELIRCCSNDSTTCARGRSTCCSNASYQYEPGPPAQCCLYDYYGNITTCVPAQDLTFRSIRYINYVDSQLMDYGSAVQQCRQLIDPDVCSKECWRTSAHDTNTTKCDNLCNQDIDIPWYCNNSTVINATNHQYNFTNLNKIFDVLPEKTKGGFGPQQHYEKSSYTAGFLQLDADSTYIEDTDIVCFSDKAKRWVIYRPANASTTENVTETIESNASSTVIIHDRTPR